MKMRDNFIKNFLSELLFIINNNSVRIKTYGEDERKKSFSSDKIPKKPLIFISQIIKIEIFFNSLLSSNFNILVY